jgi:exopolysaccharide production protein ExoZ
MAALLVILYHNGLYIFALDKYWGYDPAQRFFNFSHAGVEFFFVLSGFIILHIHWKDLGQPFRFFSFVKKRFIRIYPIYWLVLAVITPVYFLVPSFGFAYHRSLSTILSSIVLIYTSENLWSEIAVAWTLYHEILFYFIFSMAILNKRFGFVMLALWMSASAFSLLIESSRYVSEYLTSPLHLLFGMGMFACWIIRRRVIKTPAMLAISGIVLFFATGIEEDYYEWLPQHGRDLLYGLGSAMTLIGCVELERQGRLRIPTWLQLMGNASYAIYLTHFTMLSLLAKLFIHFGAREHLPILLCYILLPLLVVLFGIAVHVLIERPLLRKLQHDRKTMAAQQIAYPYIGATSVIT